MFIRIINLLILLTIFSAKTFAFQHHDTEVIIITTLPPGPGSCYACGSLPGNGGDGGTTGGQGSQDGGDSTGGSGSTTTEDQNKEKCKIKAQTAYEQCDNDATWLANSTYDNCKVDAGLGDLAEFLNINGLARALKRCEKVRNYTLYRARS